MTEVVYVSFLLLRSILGSWSSRGMRLWGFLGLGSPRKYLSEMIFLPLSQSRLLPETWPPEFLK